MGGAGNDLYFVSGISDTITELANQGIDEVRSAAGLHWRPMSRISRCSRPGNEVGVGNDLANVIVGNGGNNDLSALGGNDTLRGGDGNDRLNGGTGKDIMQGGKGNDTYHVDNVGDIVIENANEGLEEEVITTLAKYTLGANIEALTFVTAANNVATGNALNNGIEGRAGNDKFDGKAGDDFLSGLEGNDTLTGGDGDDFLSGWFGDDLLDGGNGNDELSGLDGNDTLKGGAGNDELFGEAGDDLLIGGTGDDSYYVEDSGDVIQEAANGGTDTIRANITLSLGADIENASLEVGNLTVTGNGLANVMTGSVGGDKMLGEAGNDTLFGLLDNDTLTGGDGNDVIEGGLGIDVLNGGAGNDVFLYRLDNPGGLAQLGDDEIQGFEIGKDKIDLYDLFQDFDIFSADPIGEGFLRLQTAGANLLLEFDADGAGVNFGFVTIANLVGPPNLTLADIIYQQAPLPT